MSELTVEMAAFYGCVGALAGLVHDMMATGGLVLPRLVPMPDGARILRLGFILAIVCGGLAGVLADHHWITALLAGWAGPDFIERFVNLKAATRRKG